MTLSAGSRLGVYEIHSPLGVGGMGEVYRARDTQLKRDVALKVLPAAVAADADRLARFQREAEMLAALNHSNIAHIYGIAEAEGVRALVMELVEGPTLAERVARGPLPLDEVLAAARQIADALEAAHERGIIHRDLKPANIKLTSDGVVKVLDFGLAKALEAAGGDEAVVNAPTITSPAMTRAGIILGTAAYMSPEQARGRAVDARTDIWAFGCVLYEMLTGRGPFNGETITDVLGAVVHKEPEWAALPAATPDRLRRLLARCLTKDQKQRLHHIADARLEIEDLVAGSRSSASVASQPVSSATGMSRRETIAWALVASAVVVAAALAAAVFSGVWPRSGLAEQRPLRVSIVHTEGGEVGALSISPDGQRIAYRARRADGIPIIWVRDLDASAASALGGTENGFHPFWSPDSRQIGFVVGHTLKRIPADGGPVQELAFPAGLGGAWGPDDTILYATGAGPVLRISASGGQPTEVTTLPGTDWAHSWPSFLPDGRHFVFTAKHWTSTAESSKQGVYIGSLTQPTESTRLLPDLTSAVYAPPGFLVFVREGQLMAIPFDAASRRETGEPIALDEAVAIDNTHYLAAVSAAATGTLAIRPPPTAPLTAYGTFVAELRLVDRGGGNAIPIGGFHPFSDSLALSPDGRRVAAGLQDARAGTIEMWQFNVESGARVPLTTTRGWAGSPVWSPDGAALVYSCQPPGKMDDVCLHDFRSGTVTSLIATDVEWEHPVAWSRDGQFLLINRNEKPGTARSELHVWSMKTRTLAPYIATPGVVSEGVFSPNGGYVAYSSDETGRMQVSVTTFPARRQTWPLTTDGGVVLSWRADGREILVGTLSGHIVAYPVADGPDGFVAGTPQTLVRDVGADVIRARATPDHSRLLIRVRRDLEKDKGEIRLLFGWSSALRTRK